MKRIVIIGNPGAGKSTLAVQLGKFLNLPVIHLDKEFWQPGWVETDPEIWRQKVHEMSAAEEWIIDGTYDSSIDIRLPRADTIIFLDFPTLTCIWRIFKRVFRGYNKIRPDMAKGCPEKIDYSFIRWTWNFRRNIRPRILESIDKHFGGNELINLKNAREIDNFLKDLTRTGN
jgi:adenylate kinase family enzyme